jgi:hypothetical protein
MQALCTRDLIAENLRTHTRFATGFQQRRNLDKHGQVAAADPETHALLAA